MSLDRWTTFKHAPDDEAVKLICFPHAGAGAQAFSSWVSLTPSRVGIWPLQYPGRYSRILESPFVTMQELVEELVPVILQIGTTPFAFFGHCLGALVAFELTRELQRRQARLPCRTIFSSMAAPVLGRRRTQSHLLPDDEFIKGVQSLGGISPEIVDQPELLELILPALRADFEIYERYQFREGALLETPVAIVAADNDPFISTEQYEKWDSRAAQKPIYIWTSEGHFGILDSLFVFNSIMALLMPKCAA
jgi:medium-chain acyl-[acyl-carrier-protein] hydrolase